MIHHVDQWTVNGKVLNDVVRALKNDGIVIYPTDTVYGIGCSIDSLKGIKRLYEIKRCKATKPFSFICSSIKEAAQYAQIDNAAFELMKQLTPGPYTFILPARRDTHSSLKSTENTVGIRIPDHMWTRSIVEELGVPIITTSVQIENFLDSYDIGPVINYYQFLVDVILEEEFNDYIDYEDITHSYSTVLKISNGEVQVLREGKGPVDF